jgi:hypothetical protein
VQHYRSSALLSNSLWEYGHDIGIGIGIDIDSAVDSRLLFNRLLESVDHGLAACRDKFVGYSGKFAGYSSGKFVSVW